MRRLAGEVAVGGVGVGLARRMALIRGTWSSLFPDGGNVGVRHCIPGVRTFCIQFVVGCDSHQLATVTHASLNSWVMSLTVSKESLEERPPQVS